MPEPVELDRELVVAKLPRWLKQVAAQIGELTGENIGEVFERVSGAALTREYRKRTEQFQGVLGGEG